MEVVSKAIQAVLHPTLSRALNELLADYGRPDFLVKFWDGATWGEEDSPAFTLVLNRPSALRALFRDPSELSLGEAYLNGDFDVQGDMEAAFRFGDYLLSREARAGFSRALLSFFRKLSLHDEESNGEGALHLDGSPHSRQRDRQAVRFHYDLPPDFFALWLDRHMQYSSAYFAYGPNTGLDAAQELKLEYICRKLRLQPGERLLDIGCGWGGLLAYAASHYGVDAQGITLSVRQAETARERIHQAGLTDRCAVEICDYRDLELSRPFDKIVSIGMFEHVGEALLPEYFQRVWHLLRPAGVFLNSGIACIPSQVHHHGPSFVDRYVFPDGELAPLHKSLAAAEAVGFEVRDVESLREHYAMTLHEWVSRLEAHADDARRVTDEATYRIWRLYMAGSEHQFRSGALTVYQILFAKTAAGNSGVPLTRADLYPTNGHPPKKASSH